MEKKCPCCSEVKPLALFYKDNKSTDGKSSHCIDCTKQRVKTQKKNNLSSRSPVFTEEQKSLNTQRAKAWYQRNRRKVAERNRLQRLSASMSLESSIEWRLKKLLRDAQSRAAGKKIDCNIDLNYLKEIILLDCPVDQQPISWEVSAMGKGTTSPRSPSLDRTDSSKGYIKGNVTIMSTEWNLRKKDMSLEDMLLLQRYIEESVGGEWVNGQLISDPFLHKELDISNLTKDQLSYRVRMTTARGIAIKLLQSIRARCVNKGIPFDIDAEYIQSIATINCPISGEMLDWRKIYGNGKPHFYSPSLDRIIPEKGYTKGNIRFIANGWNTRKGSMTLAEITTLISYMRSPRG